MRSRVQPRCSIAAGADADEEGQKTKSIISSSMFFLLRLLLLLLLLHGLLLRLPSLLPFLVFIINTGLHISACEFLVLKRLTRAAPDWRAQSASVATPIFLPPV